MNRLAEWEPQHFEWFSGTYNGVACSATSATSILYESWVFKPFDKVIEEAVQISLTLGDNYVDGADINILIETSSNVINKVARFGIGLRQDDGANNYGQEADTQYIVKDIGTGPDSDWEIFTTTYTFSGNGLVKGDTLSIIVYRDAAHSNDNLNGDAYIKHITANKG